MSAYDAHGDAIFRYCFFKLSNREHALDATQEVFLRFWRYLSRGNNVSEPKAFLFVTAANYIKDQYRKKKSIPFSALETGDDEQPFDVRDETSVDHVQNAEFNIALSLFKKLSDDEQAILQMRFVEDMAVKDIASVLGERENTVAVRISRTMARLRSFIQES